MNRVFGACKVDISNVSLRTSQLRLLVVIESPCSIERMDKGPFAFTVNFMALWRILLTVIPGQSLVSEESGVVFPSKESLLQIAIYA